jgi:hypothetical protein
MVSPLTCPLRDWRLWLHAAAHATQDGCEDAMLCWRRAEGRPIVQPFLRRARQAVAHRRGPFAQNEERAVMRGRSCGSRAASTQPLRLRTHRAAASRKPAWRGAASRTFDCAADNVPLCPSNARTPVSLQSSDRSITLLHCASSSRGCRGQDAQRHGSCAEGEFPSTSPRPLACLSATDACRNRVDSFTTPIAAKTVSAPIMPLFQLVFAAKLDDRKP